MSHEVQKLSPRHFKIFEFALAGLKNREIGSLLGLTPETVHNILSCPLGQAELSRRKQSLEEGVVQGYSELVSSAKEAVAEVSLKAVGVMSTLLDSQDETVQYRSAKTLMEMAFGKENQRGGTNITVIATEKMDILVQALNESNEYSSGQRVSFKLLPSTTSCKEVELVEPQGVQG